MNKKNGCFEELFIGSVYRCGMYLLRFYKQKATHQFDFRCVSLKCHKKNLDLDEHITNEEADIFVLWS